MGPVYLSANRPIYLYRCSPLNITPSRRQQMAPRTGFRFSPEPQGRAGLTSNLRQEQEQERRLGAALSELQSVARLCFSAVVFSRRPHGKGGVGQSFWRIASALWCLAFFAAMAILFAIGWVDLHGPHGKLSRNLCCDRISAHAGRPLFHWFVNPGVSSVCLA